MIMKKTVLIPLMVLMAVVHGRAEEYDLMCEGVREPLGIDTTQPHFSWKHMLTHSGQRQTAYELEVASDSTLLLSGQADLWDSGCVTSADQVMVPYAGRPLQERQLCYWRLRTWDEAGNPSPWSDVQRFAVGILNGMNGQYIGHEAAVSKLRTSVHLDNGETAGPVFAHVNSLGYHELYVNGRRVGDEVLQPAMSQLDIHSLIVTYDITPYLQEGDNEVMVWLGQGWYKTTTFHAQYLYPLLRAEINRWDGNGWQTLKVTDATWQATGTGSSYTGNWYPLMFGGERINSNAREFWTYAKVYDVDHMQATPQLFEGNRITDRLLPVATMQQPDGSVIIDFGRVVTGWLRADFEGLAKGSTVQMEYTDDMQPGTAFNVQENDLYVASGTDGETFCNRFHHHAFRYVRISGAPTVKAQALQISALPRQGGSASFSCSDDRLNAVHDMIHYTMQCLTFSGYMVDCPHLERMGYGGDGNSSTMTLQTMYDVAPTYMNWLAAWADVIEPDGSLPYVAPAGGGGGGPYWSGFFIKAPWRTWVNYGDARPLERYYEKMKLWLDYVERYTVDGLLQPWPDNDRRMWFLGDWLAPDGVDVGGESVIHANNCFISDCLGNMAAIARVLSLDDDATAFENRRQALNNAIHAKYFHNTYYANGTPLDQAYALLAGVPPTESVERRIVQKLVNDSRGKYRTHIAAGLFGVPVFTEWAVRWRQADLMADILRQPDYPGYLNMINHGATATWEYWDGQRSHVHNCYNGIGTWFYQALAGIRPDPSQAGYRHFVVDPQQAAGVTWVKATKPTPYGDIAVAWQADDSGMYRLTVTVPVGTSATVAFPVTSEQQEVFDGQQVASAVEGTTDMGYEDGRHRFLVGAGQHVFSCGPVDVLDLLTEQDAAMQQWFSVDGQALSSPHAGINILKTRSVGKTKDSRKVLLP